MRKLPSIYRREGDHMLIDLSLENFRQLFDSRDPAPFRLKDLDRDAAEYIEGAAEELPSNARLKLVVHLPAAAVADAMTAEVDLVHAVHTFFAWQGQLARNRLAALLATGRLALAIGLLFLALCLVLSGVIGEFGLGWFGEAVSEGLLIFGWSHYGGLARSSSTIGGRFFGIAGRWTGSPACRSSYVRAADVTEGDLGTLEASVQSGRSLPDCFAGFFRAHANA